MISIVPFFYRNDGFSIDTIYLRSFEYARYDIGGSVLYGVVLNSDDNFVNIDLGRNGVFEGVGQFFLDGSFGFDLVAIVVSDD